jgi:hypothetical protein
MANMQFAFREKNVHTWTFCVGFATKHSSCCWLTSGAIAETKNLRQAYILDCPLIFARKKSISLRIRREQNVL